MLRRLRRPVARVGTERLVEIPWTLSRYRGERTVLDVGSAFAEAEYLERLGELEVPSLVGVDLAPAQLPGPFDELVRADVRALPFADHSFELVLCVSTLEHVGRNNAVYGLPPEHDRAGMPAALAELRRVLVRGGRLLVTVPCGELEDHGWFLQQPAAAWLALFERAELVVVERHVFELRGDGWHRTRRFRERGVRYGARGPAASAVLCVELRAARSVRR